MRTTYVVHIVAGSLGLLSGYVALFATKGATLHRRSGMVFVATMLTMCVAGATMAAVRGAAPAVNLPAATLTAYLVVTALTAVRPLAAPWSRRLDAGALLVAFAVGLTSLALGLEALAGGGRRNGIPAFPFLMFGVVGLLAGVGDARMLRAGGVRGTARLARHLWRMSFVLFIAALSFFLGQARVIPAPVRIPALLVLPGVAVLAAMLYWLWRVRVRGTLRGLVGARASGTA